MGERDNLARALSLALAVLFLCHASLFLGEIMDDAYISFRYAHNLVDGYGLVFNIGERVEGYTNFSWVMLAAASLATGLSPSVTTPLVGALSGALLVALVWREGRRLAELEGQAPRGAGLLAAALLAMSPGLAIYAVTGLEETAYVLLSTAASIALVGRRRSAFAIYTSLAFLTRPEAGLLGVMGLLVALEEARRNPRGAWLKSWRQPAFVFVAMIGPYLAFKLWYYGSLVPNTLHAKEPERLKALMYTLENVWPTLLLALIVVVDLVRRKVSRPRAELFILWTVSVVACAFVGPDWMPAGRFLLPALPLLALAVDGIAVRALAQLRPGLSVAVVLAALALYVVPSVRETIKLRVRPAAAEKRNDIGRQLARQFNAEGVESIATVSLGMLAYEAPRIRFLDLAGLVDAEIARGPGGHLFKRPSDAYLLSRNVDLYLLTSHQPIFTPDGTPSYHPDFPVEKYVFMRPWFHQRYRYSGSLRVFRDHYYHFFRRRTDAN